jgi:vacuolar-type H+-ATPase subunit I/STV1
VKKEVPVPECLTKDPSEYTDENVAIIASYESKVQALQEERERYKTKLQTEIAETRGQLNRFRK